MTTVLGLFDTYERADNAVRTLRERGHPESDISVLAREQAIPSACEAPSQKNDPTSAMAGIGAVTGGIGGLSLALFALAAPGVGAMLGIGTLGTIIAGGAVGTGAGAGAGGILGALANMNIPHEEAQVYAEGVKRGNILVGVEVSDAQSDATRSIMQDVGALDINATREEWQRSGWKQFDETDESE
jgi:hypothetical protein